MQVTKTMKLHVLYPRMTVIKTPIIPRLTRLEEMWDSHIMLIGTQSGICLMDNVVTSTKTYFVRGFYVLSKVPLPFSSWALS